MIKFDITVHMLPSLIQHKYPINQHTDNVYMYILVVEGYSCPVLLLQLRHILLRHIFFIPTGGDVQGEAGSRLRIAHVNFYIKINVFFDQINM